MSRHPLPTGLIGGVEKRVIEIAEYDPSWSEKFFRHAQKVANTLGSEALAIEHIGSTAVPGLGAKPIIDMLLVVEDAGNEATYLPALETVGYVLRVREPEFDEHRMLRTAERDVHLHVFSKSSKEIRRYLDFRDQLRRCASDRAIYEAVKRSLSAKDWTDMNAYAEAKSRVVEEIIARAREPDVAG